MEKVYGMSFDAFENQVERLSQSQGVKAHRRHPRAPVESQKRPEAKMKKWSSYARSNRRSRATAPILADQMYAKGRPVAALNEYQRALQASPQSPVILNKLGRVMIEQNRADDAVAAVEKSLGHRSRQRPTPTSSWGAPITRQKISKRRASCSKRRSRSIRIIR